MLILLQEEREKAVLELLTVDLDFVVLAIFGLKFVNQSYWRDRSALGEGIKKLLKLQKSSSAVTVVLDCYAEVKRQAIDNTHG